LSDRIRQDKIVEQAELGPHFLQVLSVWATRQGTRLI
jgi:hypothetical protein